MGFSIIPPKNGLELSVLCLWDHLSHTGNEYWRDGGRSSNDPTITYATDTSYRIYGIKGQYTKNNYGGTGFYPKKLKLNGKMKLKIIANENNIFVQTNNGIATLKEYENYKNINKKKDIKHNHENKKYLSQSISHNQNIYTNKNNNYNNTSYQEYKNKPINNRPLNSRSTNIHSNKKPIKVKKNNNDIFTVIKNHFEEYKNNYIDNAYYSKFTRRLFMKSPNQYSNEKNNAIQEIKRNIEAQLGNNLNKISAVNNLLRIIIDIMPYFDDYQKRNEIDNLITKSYKRVKSGKDLLSVLEENDKNNLKQKNNTSKNLPKNIKQSPKSNKETVNNQNTNKNNIENDTTSKRIKANNKPINKTTQKIDKGTKQNQKLVKKDIKIDKKDDIDSGWYEVPEPKNTQNNTNSDQDIWEELSVSSNKSENNLDSEWKEVLPNENTTNFTGKISPRDILDLKSNNKKDISNTIWGLLIISSKQTPHNFTEPFQYCFHLPSLHQSKYHL